MHLNADDREQIKKLGIKGFLDRPVRPGRAPYTKILDLIIENKNLKKRISELEEKVTNIYDIITTLKEVK